MTVRSSSASPLTMTASAGDVERDGPGLAGGAGRPPDRRTQLASARHVDGAARRRSSRFSRTTPALQDLVDGVMQPRGVGQHDVVELPPLLLVHLACLQRFEIQPDRRDRRLQLVGDGVDEGVVLLVAPDLERRGTRCRR